MFKKQLTIWASALVILLLALRAAAESTWDIAPGDSDPLKTCSFTRHDICFSDLDETDETTPILDMRKCENYTVHFLSDTLADGTFDTTINIYWNVSDTLADGTFDTTINIFWNVSGTVDANFSEIVENKTLTGNPATGLDVLSGFDAPWIYADIAVHSASDVARISVQCWKRRW